MKTAKLVFVLGLALIFSFLTFISFYLLVNYDIVDKSEFTRDPQQFEFDLGINQPVFQVAISVMTYIGITKEEFLKKTDEGAFDLILLSPSMSQDANGAHVAVYGLNKDLSISKSILQFSFATPKYHYIDHYEMEGSKILIWTKYDPFKRRTTAILVTMMFMCLSVVMISLTCIEIKSRCIDSKNRILRKA